MGRILFDAVAKDVEVVFFRSGWIGIDPADRRAQCHLLRRRFSGMDWETPRLLDALDGAYDYYFDEMAQVRMPRWSSGRIGSARRRRGRPVTAVGAGHVRRADRWLPLGSPPRFGARRVDGIRPVGERFFAPASFRISDWRRTGWP